MKGSKPRRTHSLGALRLVAWLLEEPLGKEQKSPVCSLTAGHMR